MNSKILLFQVLCLSLALISIKAYVRPEAPMNEYHESRDAKPFEPEEDRHRHHHHKHHHHHHENMDSFGEPRHHRSHPFPGHANIISKLMPLVKALSQRSFKQTGNIKASSDAKLESSSKSRAYVVSKWKTQTKEMFVNKQNNNSSKVLTRTIDASGETDAVVDLNADMDVVSNKVLTARNTLDSEPAKGLEKHHKHHHHRRHHHHHHDMNGEQQQQQQHQESEGQYNRRYKRETTGDDHHEDKGVGNQFLAKVGDIFKKAGQAISETVKEYAPKFEKGIKETVDKIFNPKKKPAPNGDSPTVAPKEGESDDDFDAVDNNGNFDHNLNVRKILCELLLEDCADNSVQTCSGGEQKRLSVGLELVQQMKPNLLCIDEPTSGLDSNASELVIKCLRQLSERHRMAIVTSIHQPNSLLLSMFDELYVLSKGGHCVFTGPPNLLRGHLLRSGITCADDISSENGGTEYDINSLIDAVKNQTMRLGIFTLFIAFCLSYLYGFHVGEADGCLDLYLTNTSISKTTSLEEALKIMSEESDVIQNVKLLFFTVTCLGFVSMACTILVFPSEVRIFLSEHHNRWYSTSSYYWSKLFVEIPVCVVISVVYSTIMYFCTGQLPQTFRYSYFTIVSVCGMFIANSFGNVVGIIFAQNYQLATTIGVAFFLVLFLLGGFAVRLSTQDVVIRGLSYISSVKLIFQSIMITTYGFDRFRTDLFGRQSKPILVSLSGRINFHTLTALMGPSGAGKTTLLKCINMRSNSGLTSDTQISIL
ncbi:unnamed protein product [Oppiella nova]|uniref:ABC-2 type transporter transmembrane domain-containing protein n=1 Tax=Oppiella nova TaxID=334625 RepID=A0A7R9M5E0_9ACAR|nr:unnamed protein product [Oppiella nova]CAG2171101.1 unnamed protein product [Oppiella nova]